MAKIGKTEIEHAVSLSGLTGYSGNYRELGGGELNDTFLLECEKNSVVLRIAKYEDQRNGLEREAKALLQLNSEYIPKLIYFDSKSTILNRRWIIESYIQGSNVARLSLKQFENFGSLLAQVHKVKSEGKMLSLWSVLLNSSKRFGDEEYLLSHPDPRLQKLINKSKVIFTEKQSNFDGVQMSLVHGDATPSNVLVHGDEVGLIDWELSGYNDPMAEFATIYYEDIDFNRGKWRVKIEVEEKTALFSGYIKGGGIIDEERIRLWINHDKLGAALFLYWRIHESGRPAENYQIAQYETDLENLRTSLEQNL